jgi:hypothetical protein
MTPGSGTGFQTFVNNELPPGVAGDFAGANIKANVVGSPWGFVASPGGVTIGVGCWANPATGIASNYYQPSSFPGFVHREGQAIITTFLGISSMKIQAGDAVVPMDQGDFWGIFIAGATPGQKVYFDPVTGALSAAATGGSVTASGSAADSITAGVLTTTDADMTGAAAVGQVVTGVGVPPGTYIASAAGTGSGTHLWNLANVDGTAIPNVSGEAMNFYGIQETQFYAASPVTVDCDFTGSLAVPVAPSPYGILTITAIASGVLAAGQFLSATGGGGLPASDNIQIVQQLTGSAGSTGTYLTNNTDVVVTSTNTFVATQGKLGKISTWTRSS